MMAIDARLMRAATLLDTDPAAAAREAAEILEEHPGHSGATLLLGTARRSSGSPEAAETFDELAATDRTRHRFNLNWDEPWPPRAALPKRSPRSIERSSWSPTWRRPGASLPLHASLSDTLACDAAYARFTHLASPDQHLAEAHAALANHRLDAAEAMLRQHLTQDPKDPAALRMLAEIAGEREDYVEAERLFALCLEIAPGYSRARFDFARTLHVQQKAQPMLPLLERLLNLEPDNLQYRSLQASAFGLLGQNERSLNILESLLAEFPHNEKLPDSPWQCTAHRRPLGGRHRGVSERRRTASGLWRSLVLPLEPEDFRFTDAEIGIMQAQADRADLGDEDRLQLEFALGKALEDAGEFGESFEHYVRGNALRRSADLYEPDANERRVQSLQKMYTAEFFAARAGAGCTAPDPIFIVGLPRSGSTLLEQMLASHSQVEGTRELPDIQGFALELGIRELRGGATRLPHAVERLTREELTALGQRYLDQTRPNRLRATPYFIDKMPSNFFHVGLIQLILPNARIIDARRSPLACCFANFKQHFQAGVWFSYSLEDIGRFYRSYIHLMRHYDSVLPGRVHRVHYEALVADLEGEVRRLLDHCGLPFEERCLRFHETQRVVQTASSEQVRRPLFADGVNQWRNFEPWPWASWKKPSVTMSDPAAPTRD